MSLCVGGCLPVLSPALGGNASTVYTERWLSAVCLWLITHCENVAFDSKPDWIDCTWRHHQCEEVFSLVAYVPFSGIHVRQILHTKMVNVQYSSCFGLCGGSAKQKDNQFWNLTSQLSGPRYFVYEMLCRVSRPCLGAVVSEEGQLCCLPQHCLQWTPEDSSQ